MADGTPMPDCTDCGHVAAWHGGEDGDCSDCGCIYQAPQGFWEDQPAFVSHSSIDAAGAVWQNFELTERKAPAPQHGPRASTSDDATDLAAALAEVSRLREQGEAVRAIHEKRTDGAVEYCAEDGDSWPCDTTTALEAK